MLQPSNTALIGGFRVILISSNGDALQLGSFYTQYYANIKINGVTHHHSDGGISWEVEVCFENKDVVDPS